MTFGRLDPRAVAPHLPPEVRFMGWGGLAMAAYGARSTLQYNELIVFAVVRRGMLPAAFITHIYVDDAVSLRGGHEIWGLPKRMAVFEWQPRGLVMSVDGAPYVTARFARPRGGLPLPALVPALGQPQGHLARFWALGWMRLAPARLEVEIGAAAPFRDFGLARPAFSVSGPVLDLCVHGPMS